MRASFRDLLASYERAFPEVDFRHEPKIMEIYQTVRHHWGEVTGPVGERRHEKRNSVSRRLTFGVPDLVTEAEVGIYLRDFKLTSDPSKLFTEKK